MKRYSYSNISKKEFNEPLTKELTSRNNFEFIRKKSESKFTGKLSTQSRSQSYDYELANTYFQNLLHLEIPEKIVIRLKEQRRKKLLAKLTDLKGLPYITTSELSELISHVGKSHNWISLKGNEANLKLAYKNFIYCGPILLNINPGPTLSTDEKIPVQNNNNINNNRESIKKCISSNNVNNQYQQTKERLSTKSTFDIVGSGYLNLNDWLISNVHQNEKCLSFNRTNIYYSESNPEPPHLYNYLKKIYDIMFNEKKNQSILFKGEIGSGKTFNLIHALEALIYISQISGNEEAIRIKDKIDNDKGDKTIPNYLHNINEADSKDTIINKIMYGSGQKNTNHSPDIKKIAFVDKEKAMNEIVKYSTMNNFDVIHRSFQLMHIVGSIFRNENMESTCSGIIMKMGFNPFTGKLSSFDIDATVLDLTLPFSQNGRTLSILHALITGANDSIKKTIHLTNANSSNLNFLKKFNFVFNKYTQEKFKLCDYEVYTKFYSLLMQFRFSKTEIADIFKLLSFILQCNNLNIGKREINDINKAGNNNENGTLNKSKSQSKFINTLFVREKQNTYYEYSLLSNNTTKALANCLDLSEPEFMNLFGVYNNIEDIKTTIISLMKHTYYHIFEFILNKIREYLKIYFYCLNTGKNIEEFFYSSEKEKTKKLTEFLREALRTNNTVIINNKQFTNEDIHNLFNKRKRNSMEKYSKLTISNSKRPSLNENAISNVINRKSINKKVEKLEINEYSLLKESVQFSQLNYYNSKIYQLYNVENYSSNKNISNSGNKEKSVSPEELYLYFIDSPGEKNDQTLGGFCSNLFNECINLYGSNQFHAVVENLEKDEINVPKMNRTSSWKLVNSSFSSLGLFNFMHLPSESQIINMISNSQLNSFYSNVNNFNLKEECFTGNNDEENKESAIYSKYNKTFINKIVQDLTINNIEGFIKFSQSLDGCKEKYRNKPNKKTVFENTGLKFNCLGDNIYSYTDTSFSAQFSLNEILYDFKNLSLETRTIVASQNVENIFKNSRNSICYCLNNDSIKRKDKKSFSELGSNHIYYEKENIQNLFLMKINKIFSEIQNLQPFIIYNLHSNKTIQDYFNTKIEVVSSNSLNNAYKNTLVKKNSGFSVNHQITPLNNRFSNVHTKLNSSPNKLARMNSVKKSLYKSKSINNLNNVNKGLARQSSKLSSFNNNTICKANEETRYIREIKYNENQLSHLTQNKCFSLLSNSLIIKALYWKWFGFPVCMSHETFISIFLEDFEDAKNVVFQYSQYYKNTIKDINLNDMNEKSKVTFILSILLSDGNYRIGKKNVWLKQNSIKTIQQGLESLKVSSNRKKSMITMSKVKGVEVPENSNAFVRSNSMRRVTGTLIGRKTVDNDIIAKGSMNRQKSSTLLHQANSLFKKLENPLMNRFNNSYLYKSSILNPENRNVIQVNTYKIENYTDTKKAQTSNKLDFNFNHSNYNLKNISNNNLNATKSYNNLKDYRNTTNSNNALINKTQKRLVNNYNDSNILAAEKYSLKSILNKIGINMYSKSSIFNSLENYTKRIANLQNDVDFQPNTTSSSFSNANSTNNNEIEADIIPIPKHKVNRDCNFYSYRDIVYKKAQVYNKAKAKENKELTNNKEMLPNNDRESLKKYNILEPTKQNLHIIKSMFDFQKQNKYHVFDYREYLKEIILIQRNVKGFLGRKQYLSLSYAIYNLVIIQKAFRGYYRRKKFAKFKVIIKKIIRIQRFIKQRHLIKYQSAVKLQCLFRSRKAKMKAMEINNRRLMRILVYLEETGQIKDMNDPYLRDNINLKNYSYPKDLEIDTSFVDDEIKYFENELASLSIKNSTFKEMSLVNMNAQAMAKIKRDKKEQIALLEKLEGASKEQVVEVLMNDMKMKLNENYSKPLINRRAYGTQNAIYNTLEIDILGIKKNINLNRLKVSNYNLIVLHQY